MSEEKQYAERDLMAMDIAGNHYCRHVYHMTREKLHSKSDIAAELGWRDMQIAELKAQRDALAAENAILKSGIGFFSYGTDSGFEEHDSAEKAIAAADSDIDYYRGDACDGWSEETDCTVWGVILQRATMIDERPRTEEDSYLGSHISSICDYALLPNLATPATDAWLNSVRAEGVEMLAGKLQQLIDEGVFDAKEISVAAGAVHEGAQIAAQLRAGKDGE